MTGNRMVRFKPTRVVFSMLALLTIAACQTLPDRAALEVVALGNPSIEDPALRCPDGVVPDTAELARRINVTVERLERAKRLRAVENSDITERMVGTDATGL